MILFTEGYSDLNTEKMNDVSQLLKSNEFLIRGKKSDAINAVNVLGRINASLTIVEWKRKESQTKTYKDFIITLK